MKKAKPQLMWAIQRKVDGTIWKVCETRGEARNEASTVVHRVVRVSVTITGKG